MAYTNLPGIFERVLDGNLTIVPVNDNPIVMILGTASQGDSETVYAVDQVSEAARVYAKTGTLARGMYEASLAGALNMRLFRIGATPAKLIDIGSSPGIEVETVSKDDSAGTDYEIFYEASTGRVRVWRASDDELVYDNYPAYPTQAVDLGEVMVSGTATGVPVTDIGSLAVPVTLAAADGEGDGPAVYTAGTDGIDLSRMEMYEALYNAYELLQDQDIDVVIPMNVYLDDLNVMDMTAAEAAAATPATNAYPTAGADDDALGLLYTEEYNGTNYFWWYFPADPTSPSFSAADIYPTITVSGVDLSTQKTDGTALTAADFHEVNFAYQLASFCYTQSRDNTEMTGVIGVKPPNSFTLRDVSNWVGKLPVTTEDANGNTIVSTNGTGLLGNKFMSGRKAAGGLPAYTVDGIAGLYNGGLIATDTIWLDDTQQEDDNDHLIDIGKYISVVATWPILANPTQTSSYRASGAASYGGFYSGLPVASAPTNKLLTSMRLPFRVSVSKLDLLAGQRYVTFHARTRGIVVSDAPTAARPDSDYRRLSTVRQVKAAVDAVRRVGEPFLGEGMTGSRIAALDTAIDGALKSKVKAGEISSYDHQVIVTAQQRILGQATVELKIVPAFELRQITVVVALAAA